MHQKYPTHGKFCVRKSFSTTSRKMGWRQAGATARRQVETPASAHQRALWAAVALSSRQQNSVLSHLLAVQQQTADGSEDDLGTASKKKPKDGAGTQCAQWAARAHTPGRCDTRCSGSRSEPRFPPFSSSLASLLFYSLRLLLCTVEAAALFSDQTIILLMPAVLYYVKESNNNSKKTCQIKADMISYNQHRKK